MIFIYVLVASVIVWDIYDTFFKKDSENKPIGCKELLILSGYNENEINLLTEEECEVEWDLLCSRSPTS